MSSYPIRRKETETDLEANRYTVIFEYVKEKADDQMSSVHIIFKTTDGYWRLETAFEVYSYYMAPEDGGKTLLTVTDSDFQIFKPFPSNDYYPSEDNLLDCLRDINIQYGIDLLERVAHLFYGSNASFTGFL